VVQPGAQPMLSIKFIISQKPALKLPASIIAFISIFKYKNQGTIVSTRRSQLENLWNLLFDTKGIFQ